MVERGSPYANTCKLTLEISWELTELPADHSSEFLSEPGILRREYENYRAIERTQLNEQMGARRRAHSFHSIISIADLRHRTEQSGANKNRTKVLH
jgi:hypothetical protein